MSPSCGESTEPAGPYVLLPREPLALAVREILADGAQLAPCAAVEAFLVVPPEAGVLLPWVTSVAMLSGSTPGAL